MTSPGFYHQESILVGLQALGKQTEERFSREGSRVLFLSSHVGSHLLFLCDFCLCC